MSFGSVAKAVELKKLIDHAPKYLPKIDRWTSVENYFNKEYNLSDEEHEEHDEDNGESEDKDQEEEDDTNKVDPSRVRAIRCRLLKLYDAVGHDKSWEGFEDFDITVLGEKIKLREITQEHVEKWQATAANSPFGSVALQETQHDSRVRSSRELDTTQFQVGEDLLDAIAKKWEEKLVPKAVSVKPYKMLIYGSGDHFQYHKDTPEERLCGTFLVALFSNCKPIDVFQLSENGESVFWEEVGLDSSPDRGFCAFYPDIPHRVVRLQSGYRACLSFKIFAKESASPREEQISASKALVKSIVNRIEKLNPPLDIILRHHYGYDSNSIYGCDRLLLDGLEDNGLCIELKPILISFRGVGSMEGRKGHAESAVYQLSEESLDIVRPRLDARNPTNDDETSDDEYDRPSKRQKLDNDEEILFIHGDKEDPEEHVAGGLDGHGLWKSEVEEHSEFNGNESRPHSEQSVYVRYAAIVRPKSSP